MIEAMESRETSLRDFLAVVFRRIWIILGVFLASIGLVLALDALSPTEYESYSQVLISRGQPESAYSSRVRVLSWEEDLNSELETVRSAHILQLAQKLIDEQKVRDSHGGPIRIQPEQVTSTTPGKSSIIYVRVRDRDPVAAR
ncbi:MAG: Wzz/FepE/Etk N-terminal domain-containing protein, partial [Candidatus Eisenbacteria bacterium]|nr:Wzz/FepE/Etk N-terminal domain-containing protein [Candidatus Eisenbacteria bacterium]